MCGNELSLRITEIITGEPGIHQNKIVKMLNEKQTVASKTTIRRCLEELAINKIIHHRKNAGHVTYTASNVNNDEDIERLLRHHLDEISKVIEKTRNDIPNYHYQVKSDLNVYFESVADRFANNVRNSVENHQRLLASQAPYIRDTCNDLLRTLSQISNNEQISKTHCETLHNVVIKIRLKMSSIDERSVETRKQFSKVKNKKTCDSVSEKLFDSSNEIIMLFEELKKIEKYIQYTPDRLDEIVDEMCKRYVEERPDVATEILRMLNKYEISDDKSKLRQIVSKITKKIREYEDQQIELHKKCKDTEDEGYLDYVQRQIMDKKTTVKGLETALGDIREQLILRKPLDCVVNLFDRLDSQD